MVMRTIENEGAKLGGLPEGEKFIPTL